MTIASTLLANGLRSYLNGKYGNYGQVRELRLDMGEHRIDAQLLLNGDDAPVDLSALYTLIKDDGSGQAFLDVRELRISKAWMQALFDDRCPEGLKLKLPSSAAGFLSMLG